MAIKNVTHALSLSDSRIFQAFDTSWRSGQIDAYTHDVPLAFDLGIDNSSMISQVAHHYYQGVAGNASDLGPQLMNHSIAASYLDRYRGIIAYLHAYNASGRSGGDVSVTTLERGLPFVLSEVGNSLDATHVSVPSRRRRDRARRGYWVL